MNFKFTEIDNINYLTDVFGFINIIYEFVSYYEIKGNKIYFYNKVENRKDIIPFLSPIKDFKLIIPMLIDYILLFDKNYVYIDCSLPNLTVKNYIKEDIFPNSIAFVVIIDGKN